MHREKVRRPLVFAAVLSAVGMLAALAAPGVPAATTVRLVALQKFAGLTARDNQTLGTPPDTTGAIGPHDYVEVVNARIAVYPRGAARPVAERDAAAFWNSGHSLPVDPQVAWDDQARRWYLVAFRSGGDLPGVLMLAWSKTADPTDLTNGWCQMQIASGGNGELIDDFPKLGFDGDRLFIGTNVADVVQRKVVFSRIWVISKPKTVPGGCDSPAYTSFGSEASPLPVTGSRPAFTPVPVRPIADTDVGYVVAAQCVVDPLEDKDDRPEDDCGQTGNLIDVWRIAGPSGAPQLTLIGTVAVPAYAVPVPVPQPNVAQRLDASDARLTTAVSAPDPTLGGRTLVWTQHDIAGPGGRSEVAWYAIDPQRLTLAASGTVAVPGQWAFNAAISPTSRGNQAVVDYNVAGPSLLPQLRARVAGQAGTELVLASSAAPDQTCDPPPEDPFCPWGDYAGASADPTQPDTVWGSGQTIAPRAQADIYGLHWRTQNFALTVRQGAEPTTPPASSTHPVTPTATHVPTPTHRVTPTAASPLAATGAATGASLLAAGLLLAAGAVLVSAGRRRRSH